MGDVKLSQTAIYIEDGQKFSSVLRDLSPPQSKKPSTRQVSVAGTQVATFSQTIISFLVVVICSLVRHVKHPHRAGSLHAAPTCREVGLRVRSEGEGGGDSGVRI